MSTAPKAKAAKAAKVPKAKAEKTEAKAKKQPVAKKAKAKPAEADAAAKPAKAPKPPKAPKAPKAARKTAEKKAKPAAPVIPARSAHAEGRLAQILVAPIVSEKATMAAEKHNQVLFKVLRDATKPEIKAAVELMFKVSVDSVQTVQHKGKAKRFGKSTGRRDHVKKAYVCLAEGQELNFSGEAA
jgi:large subunit ribosomal protein L23